jgi:hypothetical protein
MTTTDLIRHIDGIELPTAGWWRIAPQRISLRTIGLRRRTLSGTASGGVTLAADPRDSTLDLLVSPRDGGSPESDLAIHATLTSAGADGVWRFSGSVDATVTAPIAVDVRYRGVYRRAERATAWLTVRAGLPGGAGRPRLVLEGDVNADFPDTARW